MCENRQFDQNPPKVNGGAMSLKKLLTIIVLILFVSAFTACESKGPAEKAGEKIDETIEKTTDKADEAVEAIKEKAEEAKETVKEKTQ